MKTKNRIPNALHVKSLNDSHVHSYLFCPFFFVRLALSSMFPDALCARETFVASTLNHDFYSNCTALCASSIEQRCLTENYYRKRNSYELYVISWQNNVRRHLHYVRVFFFFICLACLMLQPFPRIRLIGRPMSALAGRCQLFYNVVYKRHQKDIVFHRNKAHRAKNEAPSHSLGLFIKCNNFNFAVSLKVIWIFFL